MAVSVLCGVLLAIGGYFLLGWIGPMNEKHWPWISLSALAAAPPLLLTWYWRTTHKQKDIDTAEQRVRIEGQRSEIDAQRLLTEHFTRAIELLGSDRLQIRLGGIYALERMAQESSRYHWTVMETLCAFAREGTPEPRLAKGEGIPSDEEEADPESTFLPPATDIQAALTVMGRRRKERRAWERKEEKRLDLRGAHLEGAELAEAHLEYVDLRYTHLEGADLWKAHLEGADLRNAKGLTQAQIDDAIIDERTKLPEGITRPTADPALSAGA